jgi:deoxyribose-phosphate aldolase
MINFKNSREVASIIDQTLLRPTAREDEVQIFCEESLALGFAAVCIAPFWVNLAAKIARTSEVRVCTVAGFPLGFETVESKVRTTQTALDAGAHEIDYVVNLGAVKGKNYGLVEAEMEAIRLVATSAVVKIILEAGYLTQEEKRHLCELSVNTGLDFVKTSTGLGPSGASVFDVKLLAECSQGRIKVKAAGGIRSILDVKAMVEAGAHRIGTSSGKEIIAQIEATNKS